MRVTTSQALICSSKVIYTTSMNTWNRVVFPITRIVVCVLLVGVSMYAIRGYLFSQKEGPQDLYPYLRSSKSARIDVHALKNEYVKQVKILWATYTQSRDDLSVIASTQTSLLALTVPSEYRKGHLDFAIGLSMVEQGKRTRDASMETRGADRIARYIHDNPWVTSR